MHLKILLPACFCLFGLAKSFAQLPPPCPSNAFPPAERCEDACIYCNFNGISSHTNGYSANPPAGGFCSTVENEQWLGFIASAGNHTYVITPTSCVNGDGLQAALYKSCAEAPLVCNSGNAGGASIPVELPTSNLVVGQNYFLMVDGFAGDQCSFNISVGPPTVGPFPNPPGPVVGPGEICPGAENIVYAISPVNGAARYVWNAPAGATINGKAPPIELDATLGGHQVTVTFGSAGGQICTRAINSCYTGGQICKTIIVKAIPPTTLPPVQICFEDIPYTTPWGEDVTSSGLYTVKLNSWLGCDSIVRQQVTVKPPIIKQNPPQTVCIGQSITVCGQTITQQGPYSILCQSYQGCDSLVTGLLQVFNPVAAILNNGVLNCTKPTLTLVSGPSQGIKTWYDGRGTLVGTGNTLTVSKPGEYSLKVTAQSGTVTCTDRTQVLVKQDMMTPNLTASGGTLDAQHPTVQLKANSFNNPVKFSWVGPNGFVSTLKNPTVDQPGFYTVTVTNTQTGCTNSKTVEVSQ